MSELQDPWAQPAASDSQRLKAAAEEVLFWADALCREGGLIHQMATTVVDESRNPSAVTLMAWHLSSLANDLMAVKRHVGFQFFASAVWDEDPD